MSIGQDNSTTNVFSGTITGSGTYGLTKIGTGTQTLALTSPATYTGATDRQCRERWKFGSANYPAIRHRNRRRDRSPTAGTLDLGGFSQNVNGLYGVPEPVDSSRGGNANAHRRKQQCERRYSQARR